MMTVLMTLTATMIVITVTVALSTARDLMRLKARLAKLVERHEETVFVDPRIGPLEEDFGQFLE